MHAGSILRKWWHQRWLLLGFTQRELRSRYLGSIAGAVWVVLHPLLQLAIYAIVFQHVFRIEISGLSGYPFVAFVALGLWPWLAFQEGLQRATVAVKNNATLVRKVAFDHELLVVSSVSAAFATHLAGFLAALIVLSLFSVHVVWLGLPYAVLVFVGLYLLTLAFGLVLAAVQVFVPDTEQLLAPLLSLLFYATPILYPLSSVPPWLREIMAFNPLAHFVEPIRSSMLQWDVVPDLADSPFPFVLPLILPVSVWFFRRLSSYFEDFL